MAIHKYLADVVTLGDFQAALDLVPPEFTADCKSIDLHRLPASKPDQYVAEVAWAYNWELGEARELYRHNAERIYDVDREKELPGTADLVSLSGDYVDVDDYKTGFADLGPVANLWQMRLYALMASRTYGRECARVRIIRLRPDGVPFFEAAEFTKEQLEDFALEVRDVMHAAQSVEDGLEAAGYESLSLNRFTEGPHCDRCPVFKRCPAKVALVASLGNGTSSFLTTDTTADLTAPGVAAKVYQRIRDVQKVLAVVDAQLREHIFHHGPIELGSGYLYGPQERRVETVLPEKARPLLEGRFGRQLVDSVEKTVTSISIGDLEDAVKAWCEANPPAKKGATWQSTRELLRGTTEAEAAVTARSDVVFTKFKPKDETK
jgi:hypothetical protein